jgi:hypothetical protein
MAVQTLDAIELYTRRFDRRYFATAQKTRELQ